MTEFKEILKHKATKSTTGRLWYSRIRAIFESLALFILSDEAYIRLTYKKRFGRDINLKNPNTYTEKLQWMKLFYRNNKMPICTDKYEVRRYLTDLGYEHLLNGLLGVYDNANEINIDELPDTFVIKTTHGCSYNLICKNKDEINWDRWRTVINSWLNLKVYAFGREWNYKETKAKIIVEKYIDHTPLIDYKFMCFNGEPKYLQINNVLDGVQYVDFYDIDWNRVDFTYERFIKSNHVLSKPQQFEEMKEIARKLSEPFPYVRVDFYNPPNQIIFGELTFFPGSGLLPLIPVSNNYDKILGSKLMLPDANNNLELLKKYNNIFQK